MNTEHLVKQYVALAREANLLRMLAKRRMRDPSMEGYFTDAELKGLQEARDYYMEWAHVEKCAGKWIPE